MIFVVAGTGQSLTAGQIDLVHGSYLAGHCRAIAVNNAFEWMPWASALVSNDRMWWQSHPKALEFEGRKFCGAEFKGTERLKENAQYQHDCNSGLQGMRVAAMLGASRILLLGFDMHGSHFHGSHPEPLRNSTPRIFRAHMLQFRRWRGPDVVNCTPGSALRQFPMSTIEKELSEAQRSVA